MRHTIRTPPLVLLLALLAAGCASNAPYTVASASINTALALGASAAVRSAGGCWAMCSGGTVCNPRTGFCEEAPVALGGRGCTVSCAASEICALDPFGVPRCQPDTSLGVTRERGTLVPASGFSLGIAPSSGTEPPPPSRAPEPGKP